MKCRFCQHELSHEFIDLENSPASNSFLVKEQLNEPEIFYPLKVYICDNNVDTYNFGHYKIRKNIVSEEDI